jgi:hypothetical protein
LRETYTPYYPPFSLLSSLIHFHEIYESTFYAILLPTFQIIVYHLPPPKFSPNHWKKKKSEREREREFLH